MKMYLPYLLFYINLQASLDYIPKLSIIDKKTQKKAFVI